MAKDPAFLFYSQDFLVGTMTMTYEDKGKYIQILSMMHQQGRMNEETIRLLVGSVSVMLKNKFKVDEHGLWYNERLESEIDKRRQFTDSRRENGKKGGRPRKPSGKPSAEPLGKPTQNLPEDEIDNEDVIVISKEIGGMGERGKIPFVMFWDAYDKKVDKAKAMPKWEALSTEDQQDIMKYIPAYKASKESKQFMRDPCTFLNNRTWENEIISSKSEPKRGRQYEQAERTKQARDEYIRTYHPELTGQNQGV